MKIAAALALSLLAAPAMAKTATWAYVGNWTVEGDTNSRACWAAAAYKNGRGLLIYFTRHDTVDLLVTGAGAVRGRSYDINVISSRGATGTLPGIGFGDAGSIGITGINKATVRELANAEVLFLQGIGTFELAQSKAAMASAYECMQALNGI